MRAAELPLLEAVKAICLSRLEAAVREGKTRWCSSRSL